VCDRFWEIEGSAISNFFLCVFAALREVKKDVWEVEGGAIAQALFLGCPEGFCQFAVWGVEGCDRCLGS